MILKKIFYRLIFYKHFKCNCTIQYLNNQSIERLIDRSLNQSIIQSDFKKPKLQSSVQISSPFQKKEALLLSRQKPANGCHPETVPSFTCFHFIATNLPYIIVLVTNLGNWLYELKKTTIIHSQCSQSFDEDPKKYLPNAGNKLLLQVA